jgi:hypothetical protein
MTTQTESRSKRTFLIFLAVFILPVILAKFALDNQWFNQAATNKGDLLQPALDMSSLDEAAAHKWKLIYVLPEQCQQDCENALYSVAQVHSALGKHSDRAEVVVISHEGSDPAQLNKLKTEQKVRILSSNQQTISQIFSSVDTSGIFIADTLDNVILRYPLHLDPQVAVLDSRNILADLRKVLKLSRIG